MILFCRFNDSISKKFFDVKMSLKVPIDLSNSNSDSKFRKGRTLPELKHHGMKACGGVE
jgi:hypothetical protein